MAAKSTYNCERCGKPFTAREADRKRGWAKFCSKSCKASEQSARTGATGPTDDLEMIEGSGWGDHKVWL